MLCSRQVSLRSRGSRARLAVLPCGRRNAEVGGAGRQAGTTLTLHELSEEGGRRGRGQERKPSEKELKRRTPEQGMVLHTSLVAMTSSRIACSPTEGAWKGS